MKPANIILDLLRTYRQRGTTVQDLTATGRLFGFSENRIRVTLSRLVNRGIIEIVHRGHYRLCATADPVNELAEGWRLGESRVRAWTQATWICAHAPSSMIDQTKSEWALTSFGFRMVAADLWIRPDNLTMTTQDLKHQLIALGVSSHAVIIANARLEDHVEQKWLAAIDAAELERRYVDMNERLVNSLNRLTALPLDQAKKESFELGGEAIQILAKDPLLPESVLRPDSRHQLWQTMCRFDEAGRKIWAGKHQPDTTPTSQLKFETLEACL
jgi:phenylacetic acid degradation operon negative regulatory protein